MDRGRLEHTMLKTGWYHGGISTTIELKVAANYADSLGKELSVLEFAAVFDLELLRHVGEVLTVRFAVHTLASLCRSC